MGRNARLLMVVALLVGLGALAGVLAVVSDGVASAAEDESASTLSPDVVASSLEDTYAEGVIDVVLGDTISVSGDGATVDGRTVSITSAGVYSISGTLTNGQIDVDAKGKVYLELNGVDISSADGPALCITDAKKVTVTLVDGTINRLSDADADTENDAALFTNDTLIINGSGTLIVAGNNNEGISSDDDIIINSGTVEVTAVDDGLNAHDDITINGGDVFILAGGDGLDSNGTVSINGGTVTAFGGTAGGDGGLDAIGAFIITGGTVVVGGNTISAPRAESTQPSIYVASESVLAAGTVVTVTRDGDELLTVTPGQEFQNLLISSHDLAAGVSYQVWLGSTGGLSTSAIAAATPDGMVTVGVPGGATGVAAGATSGE